MESTSDENNHHKEENQSLGQFTLCGQEYRNKSNYNLSEHDDGVPVVPSLSVPIVQESISPQDFLTLEIFAFIIE